MRTLKEIDKTFEEARKNREKLEAEIAKHEEDIRTLHDNAKKQAELGNMMRFKEYEDQAKDIEKELEGLRIYKGALKTPVPDEEIKAAWLTYSKQREKEFDEKYQVFEKRRTALAADFRDLIEHQAETLTVREHCADLLGLPDTSIDGLPNPHLSELPVRTIPETNNLRFYTNTRIASDDARYFYAAGIFKDINGSFQRDHAIITLHRSK